MCMETEMSKIMIFICVFGSEMIFMIETLQLPLFCEGLKWRFLKDKKGYGIHLLSPRKEHMGKAMEESSAITIVCLNCSEERSTVKTKVLSTPKLFHTHQKQREQKACHVWWSCLWKKVKITLRFSNFKQDIYMALNIKDPIHVQKLRVKTMETGQFLLCGGGKKLLDSGSIGHAMHLLYFLYMLSCICYPRKGPDVLLTLVVKMRLGVWQDWTDKTVEFDTWIIFVYIYSRFWLGHLVFMGAGAMGEIKHLVVVKFKEGVAIEEIIKGMEKLVSEVDLVKSFEWWVYYFY